MAPQLFLGSIPTDATARRALRERAFELVTALRQARVPEPVVALLHIAATPDDAAHDPLDLLLLTPTAAVAGIIRTQPGPIDVRTDGHWISRSDGTPLEEGGLTPLNLVRLQRDTLSTRLRDAGIQFDRLVGALIYTPTLDPHSEISLDIDDHRQHLKVLGFDELAGLLSMLAGRGPQRTAAELRRIVADLLGGRLWFDGSRMLFELAPALYAVRQLDEAGETRGLQPLYEGETVIGRRRAPRRYEYRLVIGGDDLISIDHAALECNENQLLLRDTSKNGTWLLGTTGEQEQIRGTERPIDIGAMVRVGQTWLRIEAADPSLEVDHP